MKDLNKFKREISTEFSVIYLNIYPTVDKRDLINRIYRYLNTSKGRLEFKKFLYSLNKKYPNYFTRSVVNNFILLIDILEEKEKQGGKYEE